MNLTKLAFSIATMATLTASAFAQLPPSRVLTMDVAQAIAQEAMAKCRADGYKVTVLVVDGLNAPKVMLRDDGATASTTEVAKMKATATMLYNRPSGPAQPLAPGATAPPATIPGTINAQGGVPIKVGDVTSGCQWSSGRRQGCSVCECGDREGRGKTEVASHSPTSNNYIGAVVTTTDPGRSYAIQKETTQTLDIHGNVTQVNNHNWGRLSSPLRPRTGCATS